MTLKSLYKRADELTNEIEVIFWSIKDCKTEDEVVSKKWLMMKKIQDRFQIGIEIKKAIGKPNYILPWNL